MFLKQIIIGNVKWILYNYLEWKRLWGKWNEQPQIKPKVGLHLKEVMLCTWYDWKWVLYYELLLENKTKQKTNSRKYCSQLDQLKAVLNSKLWNYSKENAWSSIRLTQDPVFLWWLGKNCDSFTVKFCFIHCIHQKLHLKISIYFSLYFLIYLLLIEG